ncbi:hypothetical protein Tco_1231034 [Tanacetum coccineum]
MAARLLGMPPAYLMLLACLLEDVTVAIGVGVPLHLALLNSCSNTLVSQNHCSPAEKTWNECYDNEDELQSFRHKARQQDKVYEEREESCWILHLRTGIFYPKGHEGVMNEVPDGATIFASSYWLRNSDMYRL